MPHGMIETPHGVDFSFLSSSCCIDRDHWLYLGTYYILLFHWYQVVGCDDGACLCLHANIGAFPRGHAGFPNNTDITITADAMTADC